MDKKKAEEEVSALITGVTLLGLVLPAAAVWAAAKSASVTSYLVSLGILERSRRVIWSIGDGVGLDLGRCMVFGGLILLSAVSLKLITSFVKK